MKLQFIPYVFNPYTVEPFTDFYKFPSKAVYDLYSMLAEEMEELRRELTMCQMDYAQRIADLRENNQDRIAQLYKRMAE